MDKVKVFRLFAVVLALSGCSAILISICSSSEHNYFLVYGLIAIAAANLLNYAVNKKK